MGFPAGTQDVVRISPLAQPGTNLISATIGSADLPTSRRMADDSMNMLAAPYAAGEATLPPVDLLPVDCEADVSPPPGGHDALTGGPEVCHHGVGFRGVV